MESLPTRKSIRDLVILALVTLFITFLVWLPHFIKADNLFGLNFSQGFETIYRNYDGLEYVIIAKSFYFPEIIKALPQSLPVEYYPAHFPGYSLVILLFAPLFGFLKSMLLVSLACTIVSVWMFYLILKEFKLTNNPLILSLVFLVLPARWLVVHSVGSAEPMFILFTLVSIYHFMRFERDGLTSSIWAAALAGLLAQITRPPGILLFIAFGLYVSWKLYGHVILAKSRILHWVDPGQARMTVSQAITRYFPLLLIPFSLIFIFYWFQLALGDFWAYFHSGDNIHLKLPPFVMFNKNEFWVGDIWLEDIVYVFLIGYFGVIRLFKQKLYPMAFYSLVYLLATTFVAHRDISRYALPIFPFILISFEKILTSKEFQIALVIILFAVYMYSQNFLLENTAPVSNLWALD